MPITKVIAKKDGTIYEVTLDGKTYRVVEPRYDDETNVLTGVKTSKHKEEWLHVPVKLGRKFIRVQAVVEVATRGRYEIEDERAAMQALHEETMAKLPRRKELFIEGTLSSMPPGLDEEGERALLAERDAYQYKVTIERFVSGGRWAVAPTINHSGYADYLPKGVPEDQIPGLVQRRNIQLAITVAGELRTAIYHYVQGHHNEIPPNLGEEVEQIIKEQRAEYKRKQEEQKTTAITPTMLPRDHPHHQTVAQYLMKSRRRTRC